jgi:hypothetical protein
MNFLSNLNSSLVVAISIAMQVWSHYNAFLATFLKTGMVSPRDGLMLFAISAAPLLVLEARKVIFLRLDSSSRAQPANESTFPGA